MRPESAADSGVRFIGGTRNHNNHLAPLPVPAVALGLRRGRHVARRRSGVARRIPRRRPRLAAAVRDAKSGSPFMLIVEDDAPLALLLGSWEIYGGDTIASDDQWGEICDLLGL